MVFFHYLTIKMLYNRCTGIYKFGNNTYPRRIRPRSNLGHIFRGKKVCLMGREIRYIGSSAVLSYVCVHINSDCHFVLCSVRLELCVNGT